MQLNLMRSSANMVRQVWKRPGWPGGSQDGIFVQLESLRVKRTWFLSYNIDSLGCGTLPLPRSMFDLLHRWRPDKTLGQTAFCDWLQEAHTAVRGF